MKKQLLLFAACVALLSGCKDNDENGRPDPPATQPAITAFVFEAARNPQTLIMDIKCAIDGNEISGLIPYATDLDKLVPSFKGRFAQISVNHTVQQSGVSENDFTKEVVYTVMDSIGQTVDYKVNISCFEGAESGRRSRRSFSKRPKPAVPTVGCRMHDRRNIDFGPDTLRDGHRQTRSDLLGPFRPDLRRQGFAAVGRHGERLHERRSSIRLRTARERPPNTKSTCSISPVCRSLRSKPTSVRQSRRKRTTSTER